MIKKNVWIENIRSCLEEISDLEFQSRVWVRGEGSEVSSFTELICRLYDDFHFDDFISTCGPMKKDFEEFSKKISSFIDKNQTLSDKDIIGHPEWIAISKLSSRLKKMI